MSEDGVFLDNSRPAFLPTIPASNEWYIYVTEPPSVVRVPALDYLAWRTVFGRRVVVEYDMIEECDIQTTFTPARAGLSSGPPILFDTAIYPTTSPRFVKRFSTLEGARAYHRECVERVRRAQRFTELRGVQTQGPVPRLRHTLPEVELGPATAGPSRARRSL